MNTPGDTTQRPDGPTGDPQKPGLGWRSLAFFAGILILNYILAALFYASTAKPRVTIPYRPNFITQVQAGNVETITATDTLIQGTLRHAISYRPSGAKAVRTTEFATQIPDFANNASLDRLLADNGVVVTAKSPAGAPWWQTLLVGIGPTFLFFGLWIFLMRRYGNQAGGMFSFGQSKARKYEPTTEKVTFADVAGIDEAKEELTEVVDFLREPGEVPQARRAHPARRPAHGRPGHRQDAAGASRSRARPACRSSRMSASEFVEMIVGVGASRVRDLFKQAKEAAPSIVFIDEIDAIGRARGSGAFGGGNDEREQTLNQILTEMDGFDATDRRHRPRGDEPPRRPRLGAPAAGPLRPPRPGAAAGQGRPRADPQRPYARRPARARRRPGRPRGDDAGMVGADLRTSPTRRRYSPLAANKSR